MTDRGGKICCILGHKGGTGKTTTSINLSAALAKYHNKKVLIIDTDIQLNATSLFKQNIGTHSLYDIISEDSQVDMVDCIYGTSYENLYILPNIERTAALEQEIIMNYPKGSIFRLQKRLRAYVKKNFDFIFIDSPANLGTFPVLSLVASDYAICPVETGSGFSMDGLKEAIQFVSNARKNFNENLEFMGVLRTKVRAHELAHRAILRIIEDKIPENKLLKTKIPYNATIQTAELKKETVFKVRSNATGATAYRELAVEIIDLCEGA